MRSVLFAAILLSTGIMKAQSSATYDNVFFTNLYSKETIGEPSQQPNYRISNVLIPNKGWVLDTFWWGGVQFTTQNSVKLKSRYGTVYVAESGNIGINTENPAATLDVSGDLKTTGNIVGNDIVSGGSNSWVFHTPDDTRTALVVAPKKSDDSGWDWGKQTVFDKGNIAVNGKLEAREIKVTTSPTADFVFEESYELPRLDEVEKFIKENKHLPEIASAKTMEKEGVNIGEFQIKLLQKIEELTLYTIQQSKWVEVLKQENEVLRNRLERIELLEKKIEKIASQTNKTE